MIPAKHEIPLMRESVVFLLNYESDVCQDKSNNGNSNGKAASGRIELRHT